MSADSIHVIITVGIIALMFAWVPFLHVICPSAWRVEEPPAEEKEKEVRKQKASVAPLSSGRLAEQSREFLHALSTREQQMPGSQAGGSGVPPGSCAQESAGVLASWVQGVATEVWTARGCQALASAMKRSKRAREAGLRS